ncbi:MAG: hypothetical protein KGL37_12725 [Acidobacteriota bacterium]|nr:hypothetical protein [Acidobacteriota bacterium]
MLRERAALPGTCEARRALDQILPGTRNIETTLEPPAASATALTGKSAL